MSARWTGSWSGSRARRRRPVWMAGSVAPARCWWVRRRARAWTASSWRRSRSEVSHSSNGRSVSASAGQEVTAIEGRRSARARPGGRRRPGARAARRRRRRPRGRGPRSGRRAGGRAGRRPGSALRIPRRAWRRLPRAWASWHVSPEQGRELVAGMGAAEGERQIGQEAPGLPARQDERRTAFQTGLEPAQQGQSHARRELHCSRPSRSSRALAARSSAVSKPSVNRP